MYALLWSFGVVGAPSRLPRVPNARHPSLKFQMTDSAAILQQRVNEKTRKRKNEKVAREDFEFIVSNQSHLLSTVCLEVGGE